MNPSKTPAGAFYDAANEIAYPLTQLLDEYLALNTFLDKFESADMKPLLKKVGKLLS